MCEALCVTLPVALARLLPVHRQTARPQQRQLTAWIQCLQWKLFIATLDAHLQCAAWNWLGSLRWEESCSLNVTTTKTTCIPSLRQFSDSNCRRLISFLLRCQCPPLFRRLPGQVTNQPANAKATCRCSKPVTEVLCSSCLSANWSPAERKLASSQLSLFAAHLASRAAPKSNRGQRM